MNPDEYHNIAGKYDFLLSTPLREIRRNITTFIHHQKHRSIIDVCCGTGAQLRDISAPGYELIGIDISGAMLLQARKKSPSEICYLEQDATLMDYPENRFDAVVISFALHEKSTEVQDALWQKCWQVVRPGGHIIVADYCQYPDNLFGQTVGKWASHLIEKMAGHEHYHNFQRWMQSGALETFLLQKHHRVDIISLHFGGSVMLCSVLKEKDEEAKKIFSTFQQQLSAP